MINPELVLAHKFPETIYRYSERYSRGFRHQDLYKPVTWNLPHFLLRLGSISNSLTLGPSDGKTLKLLDADKDCFTLGRDAALYALGVGACGTNAVDANELKYVYHVDGQQFIKVLPTFAAIISLNSDPNLFNIPGMEYDPQLLLHGQQYIEIYRPLPSNSCIRNTTRVAGLHDKGKAAILEIEMTSFDEDSREPLCMNRSTIYFRGAGGFSRSSPPYTFTNYSGTQLPAIKIPKSQPFASFEDITQPSQALLYRLSGDYNPLHSDPMVAETAGFPRPILHGLCSLGFAVRAIIKCICKGNSDMVKSLSGRFLLHVFPGETLITDMWLEGLRVIYQVKVKERNKVVLSGHVDLNRLISHL